MCGSNQRLRTSTSECVLQYDEAQSSCHCSSLSNRFQTTVRRIMEKINEFRFMVEPALLLRME